MTRILVIDNYDSFVFTLVGYIQQLGAETTVIRNDEYELAEVIKLAEEHDGVLVSPGPGAPAEAGVIIDTIRWAAEAKIYWVSASATRPSRRHSAAPSPTPPS